MGHMVRQSCVTSTKKTNGKRQLRAALLAVTAGMAIGGFQPGWAQTSAVASATQAYAIPAGPLGAALSRFGDRANLQILYSADLVRGKSSPGASGDLTREQALERLLAASGLTWHYTNTNTITLAVAPTNTDDTLTVVGDVSSGVGQGGIVTEGYVPWMSSVGSKTNTPLNKVPQSISVVSRDEMDDRQVQSVVEAVGYKSGVRTGVYGFDPRFDTFHIRGFNVGTTGAYRDGLRDLSGSFAVFRKEPYGLEGISILKGSSSALYGGGSPGGIVNAVSKRPSEAAFTELEAQMGSYDHRQINFDSTGVLDDDGNVLYRLTMMGREADTQYVAASNDRLYIAPAVTFRSDDRNTSLTLLTEYTDITTGGAMGWYSLNGHITDVETGDPAWQNLSQEQWRVGYEFAHRFNDALTLRQNLRYSSIDVDMRWTEVSGISSDGAYATRSAARLLERAKTFVVDNQLQWDFSTAALQHSLLSGVDYGYLDSEYAYGYATAPSLNLATRNYGKQSIVGPSSLNTGNVATRQNQLGVYIQDQAEFGRAVLTLGGRHDWVSSQNDNRLYPSYSSEQHDRKFSGRAGLNYLFDNGVTPYVSYSTSFLPTSGNSASGKAFKPTEGEQYELGVKYTPRDLNLVLNAALFDISQKNVLATDPDNVNFQVQRGKVESQGVEIEASTSLAEGLDMTAAYTYLDMEIAAGDNAGKIPSGIPRHQVTLWSNYTVQNGFARGVGVGAGARYYGRSWGDDANTIRNDSRILADVAVSYDFGLLVSTLNGLSGQFSVKNVFDSRDVTCASTLCYREGGRTVIGSLRYRF